MEANPYQEELIKFSQLKQEELSKPQPNQDQLNYFTNTIASLELQMEQQGEREQKQTEQLDNLGQQIQEMDLLGAILPESQLQTTNISLTEWNEMRQSVNQILHAWVLENQQAIYKAHDEELSGIQRQLLEAKAESAGYQEQNLQLKRQNDELQKELQAERKRFDDLSEQHSELERVFGALEYANIDNVRELEQLRPQVDDLKRQLEESQKPKPSFQASQSVQDQIEGLRKKSSESWAEKANRGLARLGIAPIEAPDIPSAVSPTEVPESGSTFPAAESGSDQLSNGDPNQANSGAQQEVTFPEANQVSAGQRTLDGNATEAQNVGDATVTRIEFEALTKRVASLEYHVTGPSEEPTVERDGGVK